MGAKLPKKYRCFFAYSRRLEPGTFTALSQDARIAFKDVVEHAIDEVMEEQPNARIGTIVNEVAALVQDEVDELVVRDIDQQHIAKIIEAALDKFLANSDLGMADEVARNRISCLVREHIEEVAKDWDLDAYTSMEVVDDLIEEVSFRADQKIDAILAGEYLDDDDEEDCDA